MKFHLLSLLAIMGIAVSCQDKNEKPGDEDPVYHSTYEVIQGEIWDVSCTNCHIAGSSFARQSDLILTGDVSYEQLMNRAPNNVAANAAGLTLVGDKGIESLYKSFLWEKINAPNQEHFYADHPQYGSLMPLGDVLTNGQLEFIRQWILSGAPKIGEVADRNLLKDSSKFELMGFEPLDIPENGIQFHVGPFDVPANTDKEILIYQLLNNDEPIYITEVEFSMKSGSHHFLLYNFRDDIPNYYMPVPDRIREVYNADGSYNYSTLLPMQYHQFVSGTQWPRMRYAFPQGVALRVPANSGFDLNSHYANKTNETIQGEVYANIYTTAEENVVHVAEILNLNNNDLHIPAKKVTTIKKTFSFNNERTVFQLWSHAHAHMTEFKVYAVGGDHNGELVYVSYDWEHPPILKLEPPLVIPAGGGLRLETTYDNQEDRDIGFGLRSTDEMMILFGAYY